jgi:cobalt ECF transporter T component CbiQ
LRRLWLGVGLLLTLSPLGIIAVGSAWGEWTAHDFSDAVVRRHIAATSGGRLPPDHPPRGLERLSSIWSGPLARYAPTFIPSASLGYIFSATAGVGLIILLVLLARWILATLPEPRQSGAGFIERTVHSLHQSLEHSVYAEEIARAPGFLQGLDPRVKLVGLGSLLLAAVSVHRVSALIALCMLAALLGIVTRISVPMLLKKVWLPALLFSGMIALPAIFLTSGRAFYRLPIVGWPITQQGLTTASFLILRVLTAATFSALLILTTEWMRVLRALRFFRVPVAAVVILGMTYRYVFLILRTAHEMFESRQSRLVGTLDSQERHRLAAATIGVLVSKSFQLTSEVHSAMLARGFHGEVYLLEEPSIGRHEWLQLGIFLLLALAALILGR